MQEKIQARIGAIRKEREATEEEKMRMEQNARKVFSMKKPCWIRWHEIQGNLS